ncbi:PIN domain-containing protein [Streptomyces sp. NPDC088847]|uniref:PIN domain-containing protein n=1 Tax=Streptomyces sp. NPDC088847 TaxID=3365909 RepID=UPI00382672A5
MIIFDTCVVRSLRLNDSSADLLRALRAVGQRVGIPWMVEEELIAQKAIAYQEAHDSASAALDGIARITPWQMETRLPNADVDRVTKHWRERYGQLAETLPTSEAVMREALVREANGRPPCKVQGKAKTGARDGAIWLTAVEYARTHPTETVYFVSSNTKDFTDGSAYPAPMDEDVADLGDRFVHLTTLSEVIARFTKPAETDKALAEKILDSKAVLNTIAKAAQVALNRSGEPFPCTTSVTAVAREVTVGPAFGWVSAMARFQSVGAVQAYRIGEHEWYTAVVKWHIFGLAYLPAETLSIGGAGAAWTTSVLFTPNADDPRATVLRYDAPQPLSSDEFNALGLPFVGVIPAAPFIDVARDAIANLKAESARGLPRAYENSLAVQARRSAVERRLAALIKAAESDEE